ncbi:MAG: NAD(P)/FAD-dependent oxidoreductase [Actinomycetota bacterium]|nr:NAD(P)/FAD-dependent oxidoreductase [Actinomycetota bacterium]MDQ3574050.1 NAD(P)/FAD-dependent oxidoreductase [Actinomycetota bacterium]
MSDADGEHAQVHDAIVIGGGPAGLSAATWLARYRRGVLVLDSSEYRNRWVEQSHGYLGNDSIRPASLLARAREQLGTYPGTELREARVHSVRRQSDGTFTIQLEGGEVPLRARRLVLATGVKDRFPEVEGFFDHYGASVFHCPTCDGYEASDAEVVVFGWSAEVAEFAATLTGWARSVTVVTDGRPFEGEEGPRRRLAEVQTEVLEDEAVELVGERGALEGVRVESGQLLACQLAFFSIAHDPRNAFAEQLGCALTEEGCIEVDHEGATTVAGVYAAGDVTPGLQLIQVAAAKGTAAGVACALSLRGEGGNREGWEGHLS